MKRFKGFMIFALLLVAALLCAGPLIPAPAEAATLDNAVITGGVGTDNTLSTAVALPRGGATVGRSPVRRIAIQFPTLTSSVVKLQVSMDAGTTYKPLLCFNNGTNSVLASTAAATGNVIWEVPCDMSLYDHVKVECATAQAADRTFGIVGVQ